LALLQKWHHSSANIGFVIFWLLPEETFVVGKGLAGYLLHCLICVEGDVRGKYDMVKLCQPAQKRVIAETTL